MSIKKANEFYDQLDHYQKKFIQDKTINATYSIRKWLAFLSKAVAYDTYADKALKTLAFRNAWLIIFMVLSTIATFFILFIFPAPIILGVLLYFNVKTQKKFKGRDMNNYLRTFYFPVLDVLKDKAGEDAKLAASLNFNDPRKEPAEKSTQFGRNVYAYEATYILTKVILKDQSTLEFIIGDLLKDLNWTKTSASGKTKYKSKSKVAHLCIIKLSVSKFRYSVMSNELPENITLEDKGDILVLKNKIKVKKEGKNRVLSPKALFDGLQFLYALLLDSGGNPVHGQSNQVADSEFDEAALFATVWAGEYFDDYDYDSFDYEDSSYHFSDNDSESIFDS